MFSEDLSAFMNTSEFATMVTLNGASTAAIFDAAYAPGSVGTFGMASSQPVLTLATADVPANPAGLSVVANGAIYVVSGHEPDGTGISRLILEKV
jgi:hypothetical protein